MRPLLRCGWYFLGLRSGSDQYFFEAGLLFVGACFGFGGLERLEKNRMVNKRKPPDYNINILFVVMVLLSGTELLKALPPNPYSYSFFALFIISCLNVFYRGDDHDG